MFVTPLTAMIRTGARDCPRTAVQPAPAVMLLGKLLTQRSQVQILPPQQAKGQVTGGAGRPAPPLFGPIALVAKDQSRDHLCRLRLERRIAWLWTSIVNATVAWPNRSETTLGRTQAASASVACKWRRSWNRIRGSPGLRTRRSNPCETVSGCAGRNVRGVREPQRPGRHGRGRGEDRKAGLHARVGWSNLLRLRSTLQIRRRLRVLPSPRTGVSVRRPPPSSPHGQRPSRRHRTGARWRPQESAPVHPRRSSPTTRPRPGRRPR